MLLWGGSRIVTMSLLWKSREREAVCVKWSPAILYRQLDWQTPEELELHPQAPQTPDQSALQSWQPALYSRHHPQSVCSHLCDGSGQHYKKNIHIYIILFLKSPGGLTHLWHVWAGEFQSTSAGAKMSTSESQRQLPRWYELFLAVILWMGGNVVLWANHVRPTDSSARCSWQAYKALIRGDVRVFYRWKV